MDGSVPGDESYVIVCAIDFGTTYSGYAFSTTHKQGTMYMNKNWGSDVGTSSYKNPTCVLTSSNGEFKAFGYEAEKIYSEEIEESKEAKNKYNLFRHFKMVLHSQKNLNRNTMLTATNGNKSNAMGIFVYAIQYLKNHMLEAVGKTVKNKPSANLIRWVLTVPAIWTDEAKQFMREAAFKAGCTTQKDSRKLIIALEPEAASLCCRRTEVANYSQDSDLRNFIQPNTKYLVIDCGGGTVDITAHELLNDNFIQELHTATGGTWGGTQVDENFIHLFEEVLGKEFIDIYREKCPQQWFALMLQFEKMKKTVSFENNGTVNIAPNMAMADEYTTVTKKTITDAINSKSQATGVSLKSGFITIEAEKAQELFKPVVKKIISHLKTLLQNSELEDCKYFFLVGGFSDSPILQQMIKQEFSRKVIVLIPSDAQMAVVKGAVIYGHNPAEIKSRIARNTYGCKITRPISDMLESEYISSKVEKSESREVCTDIFSVFVSKDEMVEIGETRTFKYNTSFKDQTTAEIYLYRMDRPPKTEGVVDFVDDRGVRKVGQFILQTPGKGVGRTITLTVTFGGTEIQISGESAGKQVSTEIEFLTGDK